MSLILTTFETSWLAVYTIEQVTLLLCGILMVIHSTGVRSIGLATKYYYQQAKIILCIC